MANRVEYIKIARIDQNGNDNTITLESLTQLTIPYSNGNNAVYPIESITRRRDFFLYQVGPANYTPNPNDSGSLLYDFTGSLGGANTILDLGVGGVAVPFPTTTGTGSSVSFLYNSSEDKIELGTYPEKPIHIKTSTFYVTSSAEVFVDLYTADSLFTPSSIIKLTNTTAIQGGGNKGPFTREYSISSSAFPGNTFFLGATANTFPFGGGPFVKVGTLDGVKLTPLNIFITSSVESGPTIETIPEPFLSSQFYGTDCDVLLNNVNEYQENPFLQDLDYSTDPNVPINFQQIISGTAARGTVPESYYTALSQTRIRYAGVKNQSSDFNIYDPQAGTSSFGAPINLGTYGQTPSVDILDVNVYEFEWAGPTFPIISGYGMFKMGKIMQVSSKDLVKTVNPSDNISSIQILAVPPGPFDASLWHRSSSVSQSIGDYYSILDSNNQPGTRISITPYRNQTAGSNPVIPSTSRILTPSFGVPLLPTFTVTSSAHGDSSAYGVGFLSHIEYDGVSSLPFLNTGVPTTASYIRLHDTRTINFSNNEYMPGETVSPTILLTGIDEISASNTASLEPIQDSLNSGERWFATFYSNFNSISPALKPQKLTSGKSSLGIKGVAEIYGIAQAASGTGTPFDIYLLLKEGSIDPNVLKPAKADAKSYFIPSGENLTSSSTGGTGGTAGTFTNVPVINPGEDLRVNVTTTAGDTLEVGSEILAGAGSIGGCGTGQTATNLNSAIYLQNSPSPFQFTLETNGAGIVSKMIIQSAGSSGFDTNTVFTLTAGDVNNIPNSPFNNGGNATGTDTFSVAAGNLEVTLTSVISSVNSTIPTTAGDTFTVDAQDIGNASTNLVITAQSSDLIFSPKNYAYKLGGGGLGFFLWKAKGVGKNEFIMIDDSVTGETSAGAFTTQYSPEYVLQNIENITKEYGSNTE